MKIYLAGPMTGLVDNNYPAFHIAARRIRSLGYTVLSPAEHPPAIEKRTWADWLRLGLKQMLCCDVIVLLPGWEHSPGAQIERELAEDLLMPEVRYDLTDLPQKLAAIAPQFASKEPDFGCNLDDFDS